MKHEIRRARQQAEQAQRIQNSEYSLQLAEDRFLSTYKHLISNFSDGSKSMASYLLANHAETLKALSQAPDPNRYRALLAEAFATLFDRGALIQISNLNDLALADLAKLRHEAERTN